MSAEKVSLSAFWIAARCSAGRSNALRTSAGLGRRPRGPAASVAFASPSSARKRRVNTSHMRSSRLVVGEIRQRLARDGEHFLLGPAARWPGSGCWPRFAAPPRRLALKASAACRASSSSRWRSAFASSVAWLNSAARCWSNSSFLCWNSSRSFCASALLRVGVGEFRGDPLLPRVDGVEDGLVEKALHQPHQDEEVERLRTDGEPVDQHGSTFPRPGR